MSLIIIQLRCSIFLKVLFSSLVLCVSNKKKREAMNIPPEFRKELELSQEIIKPPIFPGFSWYCFIVAKPPNLLKPQHLAGDWTTRVRHLEKLGYR